MNYPNDYTTQLQAHREDMLLQPTLRPPVKPRKSRRGLVAWIVSIVGVVAAATLIFTLSGQGTTTSHVLKSPAVVKAVVAPKAVVKPLLPAEKIAKQLNGTDIVGSSKSEMQNLNTGDSAGIVADYATFQMNGVKYIVLLFTGPTTKSVAELGFAEAGLGDAAYSGPTWDVYTKAQWDKAKSAANA